MANETKLLSVVREIQTLDAKADKGPWRAQREDAITGGIHWAILPPNEGATVAFVPEDTQQTAGLAKQNAELLARYRTLAVELVREVIDLEKRCDEDCYALAMKIEKLQKAITVHRKNVWGDGDVTHPEDDFLYSVFDKL